jgi:ketosteroid isomerase-like protein
MWENLEFVWRGLEAISAWDIDALLRLYDPDVELLPLTGTAWRRRILAAIVAYGPRCRTASACGPVPTTSLLVGKTPSMFSSDLGPAHISLDLGCPNGKR